MREKTRRRAVIPAIVLLAWLGVSCGEEPEAPEPVPAPEASDLRPGVSQALRVTDRA